MGISEDVTPDQMARAYNLKCDEAKKLRKELERAYRCVKGFWTMTQRGETIADKMTLTYHSPTIGAACRFVAEGSIAGSDYFEGKHISVLHDALKL